MERRVAQPSVAQIRRRAKDLDRFARTPTCSPGTEPFTTCRLKTIASPLYVFVDHPVRIERVNQVWFQRPSLNRDAYWRHHNTCSETAPFRPTAAFVGKARLPERRSRLTSTSAAPCPTTSHSAFAFNCLQYPTKGVQKQFRLFETKFYLLLPRIDPLLDSRSPPHFGGALAADPGSRSNGHLGLAFNSHCPLQTSPALPTLTCIVQNTMCTSSPQ